MPSTARSTRIRLRAAGVAALVLAATAGLGAAAAPLAAPGGGVDPGTVELTLGPGQSATIAKRVTTPATAPKPDIVILGDTTGSMDPVVANVRNNIQNIIDRVRESQPTAQFAISGYKDQVDGSKVFTIYTPLTPEDDAIRGGMEQMSHDVIGGGAPWTDYINAHYRIATDAIAFRPNSTRIIAWFGDAASRDPSLGHTLADTNAALQSVGARVIAVPVVGTSGDGLDRLGQATSITSATRGRLMSNSQSDVVAQTLLDGVQSLDVTVTPRITSCDSALTVGFDPASRTVQSGTDANFNETFQVRPDAAAGTYRCTVDFLVNGVSQGFVQTTTVHVPGLSIGDVTVTEGNSGTTLATFPVTLDRAATSEVRVHWATSDGTATAPGDYTAGSGDLVFPAGVTSQSIPVPIIGDLAVEPDESFALTLSAPNGAAVVDSQGVGTIGNDDGAQTSRVSVGDVSATEGNSGSTEATFTVSLDRPATAEVSVRAATADGTATAPGDYAAGSDVITFAPGETSKPFTVAVVGETAVEPDETFTVTLSEPAGVEIADGQGVGTIVNDDTEPITPRLSIGDSTVAEGGSGTTPATFTITLDQATTVPVSVHWATADGTATAPGDYTAGSGDETFAPGQTSRPVSVPVVGDLVPEPDETFTVSLSNPVNATIADGQGVGVIANDDTGESAGLSINDVTVDEDNAGTTQATFTVSLDQPATGEVSVQASTADGTATAPGDYTATSGPITFAAGETSKPFTVDVVGDTQLEPDETFTVNLTNAIGADIADGQGVGTIVNNDQEPSRLSIGDVTVTEGDSGNTQATFTITLDRVSTVPVTVQWATGDGTAVAPGDYTAGAGNETFTPGETSRQVNVPVIGDTTLEPDESFVVTLSNPTGADIADGQGVGVIVNDDTDETPRLSVSDVTVTEGDTGTVLATFTVSLSHATGTEVRVDWATADGTAVSPGDYTASAGSETFAPGQTSRQVSVPIVGDTTVESVESFTVNLSNSVGAEILDPQGVGTIQDDDGDPAPQLSIGDVSVVEGNSGTTQATFTVTLDRPGAEAVSVRFATADGTAAAPGDYLAAAGPMQFPTGVTSAQITVDIVGDLVNEPTESFTVTLSDAVGAGIADGQGVGTIVDNDPVGRDGVFSCMATALNLVSSTANPPNVPCRDDARTTALVRANLGLLTVRSTGLTATTDQTPDDLAGSPAAGDNATARAELSTTRISTLLLTIEVGVISSTSTARCVAGPNGLVPQLSGSSTIASLKINGVSIPVGSAPLRIPLLIGSLELNTTATTATSVTQRAFALTTLLGGVVIGEATAGVRGSPCGS